jgi:hypothetical protein
MIETNKALDIDSLILTILLLVSRELKIDSLLLTISLLRSYLQYILVSRSDERYCRNVGAKLCVSLPKGCSH